MRRFDTGMFAASVSAFVLATLVATSLTPTALVAATAPIEPETENVEMMLDLWTNRIDREWREVWDAGDNRYRLRLGSNNVRHWFFEEELKLTAPLADGLRFRFHHARQRHDSSRRRQRDALEFEARFAPSWFVSVTGMPSFEKARNSVGIALQRRLDVARFARLAVEFPHVVRNWAERHRERDDEIVVFARKPVRCVIDAREKLPWGLWARVSGELVPEFETATERAGVRLRAESGETASLGGWVEWTDNDGRVRERAFGVGYHFARTKKQRSDDPAEAAARHADRRLPLPGDEPFRSPPGSGAPPAPTLPAGADSDFYTPTTPDSVAAWYDRRSHVEPYVWLPRGERWNVRASVIVERRTIRRHYLSGERDDITATYFVPGVSVERRFGRSAKPAVEVGFALSARRREHSDASGLSTVERFRDHRVHVGLTYRFAPGRILRLIETIDLDREDWGDFWIHDHAFAQAIFSF